MDINKAGSSDEQPFYFVPAPCLLLSLFVLLYKVVEESSSLMVIKKQREKPQLQMQNIYPIATLPINLFLQAHPACL